MKTKSFIYNSQQREYHVFGKGDKILYAFHGFGQTGMEWKSFKSWLSLEYKVYAFNDFFHSEGSMLLDGAEKRSLTKREIVDYFNAFVQKRSHTEVNLMAYSSGAITALTLIEFSEINIKEVFLFAPDGIRPSFWKQLFCKYPLIRKIFKRIIASPYLFFKLVRSMNFLGLIGRDLSYFVLANMRTKQKRQQIYDYWMCYALIHPQRAAVLRSLIEKGIQMHLIFGKRDNVINKRIGLDFIEEAGANADYFELEEGHQLIQEKYAMSLKEQYAGN